MITISRLFEWDMGHRVPNHESLCKNPHGHRYSLEVHVAGPISQVAGDPTEGMVIDFGKLKSVINERVIDPLDHSFMYHDQDSIMHTFAETNDSFKLVASAYVPTAEAIVSDLAAQITAVLSDEMPGVTVAQLVLYETPKSKAIWSNS
jgi:6-pyruvoyltetrahydropterin/6-carboxytetrahydropterin synthase